MHPPVDPSIPAARQRPRHTPSKLAFGRRLGTPTGSRGEQSPKPELDPYGRKALRWVPLTTFDLIHVRLPHRMRRMQQGGPSPSPSIQ